MANKGVPRIFLCHAKEDKARVIELYQQLKATGYSPWLDEEDLLPGVDWDLEIRRAIRGSAFFLACLSKESIDKRGYVQKELKMGLDVLDEMPEGKIYLIPVRFEACDVPERLGSRQWVDLFAPRGFEKLKRALDFGIGNRRTLDKSELSDPSLKTGLMLPGKHKVFVVQPRYRRNFEPDMFRIPAGEFLMGSDPNIDKHAQASEQPQHTLYLPDYYMGKTPVTNAQYAYFVQATDHGQPMHWKDGDPPGGKDVHPVVEVSWVDAMAYCNWLSEVTGRPYRLPSEAEWEKVARGTDGRIYPWGNEWDPRRCNSGEGGPGDTTPVGAYLRGASPYGLLDMAGNVWEWTLSLWGDQEQRPDFRYPYEPLDGRESLDELNNFRRVLRGGSFNNTDISVRCAYRISNFPNAKGKEMGFRVAMSPSE
jgi:formylglycine-generating enzyme required for sulfatase activity